MTWCCRRCVSLRKGCVGLFFFSVSCAVEGLLISLLWTCLKLLLDLFSLRGTDCFKSVKVCRYSDRCLSLLVDDCQRNRVLYHCGCVDQLISMEQQHQDKRPRRDPQNTGYITPAVSLWMCGSADFYRTATSRQKTQM